MTTQYIHYPVTGGGGGAGVSSLNTLTGALTLVGGSGITITPSGGNTLTIAATGGGSGTVTSVALAAPSIFTVSGSPITTSGTLTLALATETANTVFAGPASGGALAPTFRALVAADIPSLSYISALTGDVTATGPGSVAATLATVNSNVGSFTNANITVNAKGLITAASNGSAGTGTVTSVSVVSANGLAGTVATSTTTPAITLSTSITGILQGNGTAISAATTTGSGAVVLATSPTLVTPALGTPSAVVLTSGTGLPLTTGVTGVLPTANGGTNISTYTTGDTLYASATNVLSKLPIGSTNAVLTVIGGIPSWQPTASSTPTIFGTRASPLSIVAATGITSGGSAMSTTAASQDIYVQGSVAGDSICATITQGTIDGQRMSIIGRSDSQTLTLDSSTTNVSVQGSCMLGANTVINLRYDLSQWVEVSRTSN